MNLSQDKRRFLGGNSAGGDGIGAVANSPAQSPLTVGAAGFGPSWTVEDSMAASIIRLEQENQELRAEIAVAEQERAILVRAMERVREQWADDRCRDKCRDKAAADGNWSNI